MKTEAEITALLATARASATETERYGGGDEDLLPVAAVIDTLQWVLGDDSVWDVLFTKYIGHDEELPPELATIVEKAREGSVEWSGREGRPKRHTD